MLFHSQVFLILFLPLVVGGYYALAARRDARLVLLLVASLAFYGYWDVRLVPLLAGSVVANWLFARAMRMRMQTWLVIGGIALNLALIGVFKYADFFAASLAWLIGATHRPWSIILPLGISFFTFQQISYLVDLRRGRAPLYRFHEYALYVCFFPQLIAGPIVRHDELIFQFARPPLRAGLDERIARGFVLFIIGLSKKVFIADNLARIADPTFAAALGSDPTFAAAWLAAGAFTLQLYFDFSGYSDMALGLGLLFGFTLPVNFDAPYRATSIRAFWQRWHMTLSRFLRDYLYIPLGGNRHGEVRRILAVLVTMLLGGLWHGAGWTFVAWGALHGVALALHGAWRRGGYALPGGLGWLATMLFVMAGWVLFRAESFDAASRMLAAMAGAGGFDLAAGAPERAWLVPLMALVVLAAPTSQRIAHALLLPRRALAAAMGLAWVVLALAVGDGANYAFIYFQF